MAVLFRRTNSEEKNFKLEMMQEICPQSVQKRLTEEMWVRILFLLKRSTSERFMEVQEEEDLSQQKCCSERNFLEAQKEKVNSQCQASFQKRIDSNQRKNQSPDGSRDQSATKRQRDDGLSQNHAVMGTQNQSRIHLRSPDQYDQWEGFEPDEDLDENEDEE